MKQLLTKSLPLFALLLSGMLQAQTPFWSEDFTAGIPSGWTNTDASGQGFVWEWCADLTPTCAPVFSGQAPFAATSADSGFVHVNSDGGLSSPLAMNHISRLTTAAIDCSGKPTVFVKFESHIGTFQEPLETNAIIRVSTDQTNWTEFTPFPGFTEQNYFSPNPFFSIIDISSVAGGSSTVYIQWQWTANWEYMWDLDDIALYDENPTPPHDVAVGDFFFAASSLAQPVSQIATDTFGFYAYLSNNGSMPQTNILLKAQVTTNTDEVLYADSMLIPSLDPGVVDSLFQFTNQYAPELPIGEYRIKYSVKSDSTDLRPADNNFQSPFFVTANIFSKENGIESGLRPGDGGDWAIGNMYRMSAGSQDNYQASLAQFAFATNPGELPVIDVKATVYLFRVSDDVDPDFSNFDDADLVSPDLNLLGFFAYDAPDTISSYQMQTVEITDINSGLPGVLLEKGVRYILAVGYDGTSNVTFHAINDDVKMFFVSTLTYSTQWFTGGFGEDANAVLRMAISLVSTTDNKPLPESAMKVFPNPIRENLSIAVDFAQPTDATITIADLTGRVIEIQDREALTKSQIDFRLPQLASGTYLVRIATPEGTLTKKFMVQK